MEFSLGNEGVRLSSQNPRSRSWMMKMLMNILKRF